MSSTPVPGILYVVPTPIGNLEDITLRALRVLREVDAIACEDTRVTGRLLQLLELPKKRLLSLHAHNERGRTDGILEALRGGTNIALVSDAGTPGISDPGGMLIAAAIAGGFTVEPLPGPSAVIPALVASGFPTTPFLFEGFLPHKKGRQTRLRQLAERDETIVLYESPHRIVKMLRELAEHLGPARRVVVCRELTKLHEEIVRGSLSDVLRSFEERESVKGEIVVVVEGRTSTADTGSDARIDEA